MADQLPKPHRRWFQFSLRSLLIAVTLVAGLLVAWRAYVEPYRRQREVMKLIEELGGEYNTEPGGPSWLRGIFGDDNFQNIIEISLRSTDVSDADLTHLKGLANLRTLSLSLTSVGDAGLAHLKGLTNLKKLVLCGTRVSDVGLSHLKALTNLQELWLGGAQVSDVGAKQLQKALPNCQIYMVRYTQDGIYP